MRKFLLPFSYLFHPVFIPCLGTFLYGIWTDNYLVKEQFVLLLIQVSLLTVLLPLTFFYVFKTLGKVDSIMISDVSQRKIPLILQVSLTFILIYKSITIDRFNELYFFFLGGIGSMLAAFGLTFAHIKVSLHMVAMSSLTLFAAGLALHYQINGVFVIAFLFIISGFVASSRIEMKAHTLEELMMGYVIGMLPQLVLWMFWL